MTDAAVLLIQADGAERERTLSALRHGGSAPLAAVEDAAEAAEFLEGRGRHASRAAARQPRVLLVDLPLVAGLSLLESVRGAPATAGLPVIVLLAPAERGQQDAWYRAGANSVVLKSADDAEMRRKMQRLLEFWITVNVANRASKV